MSSLPELHIRRFVTEEGETLHRLMHDTIRTVAVGLYTPAQVAAWAPDPGSAAWRLQGERLFSSLLHSVSLVAEAGGAPVGFGTITAAAAPPRGRPKRFCSATFSTYPERPRRISRTSVRRRATAPNVSGR